MNPSDVVRDFSIKLSCLRDFPDRAIIFDLTKHAEDHIQLSNALSNVLLDRLLDPATNLTFKLPTFYLMDSIMKHVGGPYPALFSRRLYDAYLRAFTEVSVSTLDPLPYYTWFLFSQLPEKDQSRLDVLLGTWEERELLSKDLLSRMRANIEMIKLHKSRGPPRPEFVPEQEVMFTTGKRPPVRDEAFVEPFRKQVVFENAPIGRGGLGLPQGPPALIPFEDVFERELMIIYNEMYVGVEGYEMIPLEQLAVLNPQLFDQMRLLATQNAEIIYQQMLNQTHQPQLLGNRPSGGRGLLPAVVDFPEESAPVAMEPVRVPLAPQLSISERVPSSHQSNPQLVATSGPPRGSKIVSVPGAHTVSSATNNNRPSLISAFVGETPVKLGVNRMLGLCDRMNMYKSEIVGDDTNLALLTRSDRVVVDLANKLQHFLNNVHVPPKLPSILLGLLPLEPSKEFVNKEAVAHQARIVQTQASRPKIEMPKFRVDELSKPVKRGIQGLYSDQKFQYMEVSNSLWFIASIAGL
jgi:hypothetical protein